MKKASPQSAREPPPRMVETNRELVPPPFAYLPRRASPPLAPAMMPFGRSG